jgi:uncharacterized membrane protein
MRTRVVLAVLVLILLAASVGPATAQGCDDCRELKQELRGGAVAATLQPAPPPSPAAVGWPSATNQPEPVVRAVMFWLEGCGHCHEVMDKVLPPLQRKYGRQLEIRLIEVVTTEDIDRFYQVAAGFGFERGRAGVPFLIIGDRVLMGTDPIAAELPGLIEQHLAAGGVDWPAAAGLAPPAAPAEICAPATPCTNETPTPAALAQAGAAPPASDAGAAAPRSNGFVLALIIMAGMVAALAYTGVQMARGPRSSESQSPPGWLTWVTPLLALIGLGVAGYLAYVETRQVAAVCGPVGDCNAVQASPYARLFGVLPIGVLGALGYVALLTTWLWGRYGRGRLAQLAPLAVFALALFGVLFSLYLTYLEPFVIRAVCAWCLTSAVIMTLLLLLAIDPARRAWYRASTRPADRFATLQGEEMP